MNLIFDAFVFEPKMSYGRAFVTVAAAPMVPLVFTFALFGNGLANSFVVYLLLFILFWGLLPEPKGVWKKTASWGETVGVGFTLFGAHTLIGMFFFAMFATLFSGGEGLKHSHLHTIGFIDTGLSLKLLEMIWVSIGEEMVKVTIFTAFVRIFSGGKFSHILCCAGGASLIFGYWHGLSFTSVSTSIALSSIPDFLMFAYYRSIIPPVIAHFLTNAAVVLAAAGLKAAVGYIYLGSLLAFAYIIWLEQRRFQREILS